LRHALRLLDDVEIVPADVALHRPTLDDVFLTLTGRSLRDAAEGGGTEPEAAPDVAADLQGAPR
jgi:ABC-2 type transport system ATP-binding protein